MKEEKNYRIGARFRHLIGTPIENAELYLTVCGTERCEPSKSYGPGIREDYHLHFIISGKGRLHINGVSYELKRGQIFLVPPCIEVSYYADAIDPWQYAWISFSGTKAKYYMEKAGLTANYPTRDTYAEPEEFLVLIENKLAHKSMLLCNSSVGASHNSRLRLGNLEAGDCLYQFKK